MTGSSDYLNFQVRADAGVVTNMPYGIILKKAPHVDLDEWLKNNKLTLEILEYGSSFRATLTPSLMVSYQKHSRTFKEWTAETLDSLLDNFCRTLSAADSIHYADPSAFFGAKTVPVGSEIVWNELSTKSKLNQLSNP